MKRVNGLILYEGPSAIDGEPIVVIAVGIAAKSTNQKTGGMIQTYILRSDIAPLEIMRRGLDASICGDCIHSSKMSGGEGTCYVNVGQGPRAVFDAYQRGRYRRVSPFNAARCIASSGIDVRIGAYGDPGAVPNAGAFWALLVSGAPDHTGYTHRHSDTGASLRGLVMASADSVSEAERLKAAGWGTFRVSAFGDPTRLRGEARCPASEEAGRKVTCDGCPIKCNGAGSRVIQAHGASKRLVAA